MQEGDAGAGPLVSPAMIRGDSEMANKETYGVISNTTPAPPAPPVAVVP